MIIKIKSLFAFLLIILTVTSVNQWSTFPIGNTTTDWFLFGIITTILISGKKYFCQNPKDKQYMFVQIYVFWILTCIIRGFFVAEFYWDFKSLLGSGFALLVVLSIYIFSNPEIVQLVLKKWLRYALPLFFVIMFFITTDSYGFFLVPISFLTLFTPLLSKKWRYIFLGLTLFIIFIDLDARTSVIKFLIPIIFSFLLLMPKFINSKNFKALNQVLLILPIIFFTLAITGTFNIFKIGDTIKGTYTKTKVVDGEMREFDLKHDSRTFLYVEVLNSAIKHDYILFGRTPARGNDSFSFGSHSAEELGTGRYERYSNEVSILNIFTWTGLTGVVLYFLIFFKASQLAIIHSNNQYVKLIGLYVSFRWVSAWVEDFNRFDIMNFMLFMSIAICFSSKFRLMTNAEFRSWLNGIFSRKKQNSFVTINKNLNK